MKKTTRMIMTATLITALSATGAIAFADTLYKTPAEILSGLTGKSVETVTNEKISTGKTYGTLAKDAGQLDAFKAESLESKKAQLDAQVKAGQMTQAQADTILNALKANQATCDGTGTAKIGQQYNAGFGSEGQGLGNGGQGRGHGQGRGNGMGGRGMGQHVTTSNTL